MKSDSEIRELLAKFRFDVWNLVGPRNADFRQHLMIAITGQKLPLAKCGVTAIHSALEERFPHVHLATCKAKEPEALQIVLSA